MDRTGIVVVKQWDNLLYAALSNQLSPEQTREITAAFEQRFADQQPFLVLIDLSASRLLQFRNNSKFWRDWVGDHQHFLQQFCCGSAIVIPQPGLREIVRAIVLLVKPNNPCIICADLAEALAWLTERAAQTEICSNSFPKPETFGSYALPV